MHILCRTSAHLVALQAEFSLETSKRVAKRTVVEWIIFEVLVGEFLKHHFISIVTLNTLLDHFNIPDQEDA